MADPATCEMILRGGDVLLPGGLARCDVGVTGGRIRALLAPGEGRAAEERVCVGLTILPGLMDPHVHLREPGMEHKEDMETGSRAAVMGGVTALCEMPNAKPLTDSRAALDDKLQRAQGRVWTDYAFYIGATIANADQLGELELLPGCAGVKVFMGASTGDLLVPDDANLLRVLKSGRRPVHIHAEDECRLRERKGERIPGDVASHPRWRDDETALRATQRIVALARQAGRRVHILHVSNPAELAFLADHRDIASAEVTPQHLTLAGEEAYPKFGSRVQMNPPIRSGAHRAGLWHWLRQGVVDTLGSDHAPHTLEEKARPYPDSPSGIPGVQTIVPLMLDYVLNGRLTLLHLADLMAAGPARIYGMERKGRIAVGYDANFTIVDLKGAFELREDWIASRCGWSPFTGMRLKGRVVGTFVGGQCAMWEEELAPAPAGRPIRFLAQLRGTDAGAQAVKE